MCNAVTKAITDGINFVTDAMVSIGKVIGSTLDKLYDAAIQGVFKFYRYVIPNDSKRSTSQYDAFNFWRGDSIMDAGTDFFIRVDTKEWTKFSVGIGISLPDTEPAWPTFMECRGKNSDENAAWWYVSNIQMYNHYQHMHVVCSHTMMIFLKWIISPDPSRKV